MLVSHLGQSEHLLPHNDYILLKASKILGTSQRWDLNLNSHTNPGLPSILNSNTSLISYLQINVFLPLEYFSLQYSWGWQYIVDWFLWDTQPLPQVGWEGTVLSFSPSTPFTLFLHCSLGNIVSSQAGWGSSTSCIDVLPNTNISQAESSFPVILFWIVTMLNLPITYWLMDFLCSFG